MRIVICNDYQELSKKAAEEIIQLLAQKTDATLGLATGSTPIGMYKELINAYIAGVISFKDVKSYNLDEYCNLPKEHEQSYYSFMNKMLFDHIDINKDNTFIPSGIGNLDNNASNYQKLLANNPRDIQVLGIGSNGHLGFNEPGTPFNQKTFIVDLTEQTRVDNKRFFNSIDEVPTQAITMGLSEIMNAKKIILLASGKGKKDAIAKLLDKRITPKFPASILHEHSDVIVFVDKEAYPYD